MLPHCFLLPLSPPSKLPTPPLPFAPPLRPVDSLTAHEVTDNDNSLLLPVACLTAVKVTDEIASLYFPVASRCLPHRSTVTEAVASNYFPIGASCFPHHPQGRRHRCFPSLPCCLPLPPSPPSRLPTPMRPVIPLLLTIAPLTALKATDTVASRYLPGASHCLPHRPQRYRHRCFPLLPCWFPLPPSPPPEL